VDSLNERRSAGEAEVSDAARRRNLDQALVHGIGWTAVWRWGSQLISWGATAYAARVLAPTDFGLAAMASLAVGLARMIEDLGLDAALVQNRSLNATQVAQLGGLAVGFGGLLTVIYVALAYPIAGFFHEPQVAALVAVLSPVLLADACQVVPRALLQIDLAFQRLAWLTGLQNLISAAVLAAAVAFGLGYWALILNTLTASLIVTGIVNYLRPHRLQRPSDLKSIAHSVRFGWRMLVSRIAWWGYSNADSAIVGREIGKEALGAYSFATTFAFVPLQEIVSVLSRVIPGVFSAVQANRDQLRRYLLLLTEALSYITFPMALGIALVADDLVALVLGPQWSPVVTPLRILAVYMAYNSVQMLLSHILIWTGRVRANMWLGLLALAVLPPLYFVASRYGTEGVAWAVALGYPLVNTPVYILVFRVVGARLADYLRAVAPALACCAIMVAAVLLLRMVLPSEWAGLRRLAAASASGAACYFACVAILFWHRIRMIIMVVRGREPGAVAVA